MLALAQAALWAIRSLVQEAFSFLFFGNINGQECGKLFLRLLIGRAVAFIVRLIIRARRKLIGFELTFDSLFSLLLNMDLLLRIRFGPLLVRIRWRTAVILRIFDPLRALLLTEANLFAPLGSPMRQIQLRFFYDLLFGRWIMLSRRFYAWIAQIEKFSMKL